MNLKPFITATALIGAVIILPQMLLKALSGKEKVDLEPKEDPPRGYWTENAERRDKEIKTYIHKGD